MGAGLLRAGFVRRGMGPNFVCTLNPDIPEGEVLELGSWYLTRGDTDLY
jgi:hypothetical protein